MSNPTYAIVARRIQIGPTAGRFIQEIVEIDGRHHGAILWEDTDKAMLDHVHMETSEEVGGVRLFKSKTYNAHRKLIGKQCVAYMKEKMANQ